jgi:hypothetical protein
VLLTSAFLIGHDHRKSLRQKTLYVLLTIDVCIYRAFRASQATFSVSETQLLASQLFAHEKTFPPDPLLSSTPDDHIPNAN